jgi:hypothetical protein
MLYKTYVSLENYKNWACDQLKLNFNSDQKDQQTAG